MGGGRARSEGLGLAELRIGSQSGAELGTREGARQPLSGHTQTKSRNWPVSCGGRCGPQGPESRRPWSKRRAPGQGLLLFTCRGPNSVKNTENLQ